MKRKRESEIEGEPMRKVQKMDGVEVNMFEVERGKYHKHASIEALPFFGNAKVEAYKFEDILPCKIQHGFLKALHICFTDHQALELNADHFWLLILQGLAHHEQETKNIGKAFGLNEMEEKKKGKIKVRRDEFILGGQNNWEGVFPEFVQKIHDNIPKELSEVIDAKFSTSTLLSKTSFYVSIMDCVQNYFEYRFYTLCGIPKVVLKGKKEDYELVLDKVCTLGKNKELDLKWWTDALEPILKKIIKTFDGEKDSDFWGSIYKYHNELGSGEVPEISGWISAFIPYTKDTCRKDLMKYFQSEKYNMARIKFKCLPYGISYAPFIWKYGSSKMKLSFYAGFFGCKQNEEFNITPTFGWAVCHGQVNPRKEEVSMFRF